MSHRPLEKCWRVLPGTRPLPTITPSLRARPVCRRGLVAGVARRIASSRPGLRSSSHYPLGNCVDGRRETCRPSDSTRARFLIAARRTVPGSCRRPVMTPAGGTGDICLPSDGFIRDGGERGASCRAPFPGYPGLSQPCSQQPFRTTALRLFYQGTRHSSPIRETGLPVFCQSVRTICGEPLSVMPGRNDPAGSPAGGADSPPGWSNKCGI